MDHSHIYMYEKVSIDIFKNYFKSSEDYIPILYDLATFFDVLDTERLIFQDACWENFRFNTKTKRLCIVDIDSMVNQNDEYKSLGLKGASDFHISFKKFEKKI